MKRLMPVFDEKRRSHLRPVKRNYVNKMTGEGYKKTVYVKPDEFDRIMKRRGEKGEVSQPNDPHRLAEKPQKRQGQPQQGERQRLNAGDNPHG